MIDRNKSTTAFSEPKDIFDILQFKFKHSKSAIEQQIIEFQKNYYKQYSAIDQTVFISQVNETSVKETLTKINFQVPFNINIISTIKDSLISNPQTISDVFIIASLIQSLAYLVSNEKPQDGITNLFTIYTFLIPSTQHRNKIITTFILLLKEYSNSTENNVTDEIHKSILNFIKQCDDLPATFSDSLFLYMKKVSEGKNQKQKLIGELFDLTKSLITSQKLINSISNNEIFYEVFKPFIFRLHVKALDLLHTMASTKSDFDQKVANLFVLMAKGLNCEIKKNKEIFIPQPLTEFPTLGTSTDTKFSTDFMSIPLFEYDDRKIESLFNFEKNFKISVDFTPKYLQCFLSTISARFIGIHDEYSTIFLKRIIKSAQKKCHLSFYADYFSVIVFFSDQITQNSSTITQNSEKVTKKLDDNVVRFLMSTIIFHSTKFTGFLVDGNNMYYYLQYSAFSLIVKNGNSRDQSTKVLLNFAAKMSPFIYSEILLFLLSKAELFDHGLMSIFCNEKQIESFMNVMVQLQDLFSKDPSENCRLARIICFHFFFKLFDDPSSFLIVATINNFSKGIENFIFEQSLTDLIIEKLEKTFSKFPLNLNNQPFFTIIPIFNEIFEKCTSNISKVDYKNLGVKLATCIFNSIKLNSKMVAVFYPNFVYLLKFFKESQEIEFLDGIFHFLLQALNDIKNLEISYDVFDILFNFLKNFLNEKSEFSDKIKLNFYSLLCGKEIIPTDHKFVIKNHQIIPLFVSSFSCFENFNEILSFFSENCEYSLSNCVACHDGDLDYFLINFMKKESNFYFNGHQIQFKFDIQQNFSMIFKVISQIIRVKTSTFICDQLFQLLIPSSPSYQISDVENNLNLIDQIIKENLNERKPTFDLVTNKTLCEICGFNSKYLNNDFAFSFTLKIDVPQIKEIPDEFTIALFEGADKVRHRIYLKSNFLSIKVSNEKDEMATRKQYEIPNNEWINITLIQSKIKKDKPEFILKIYVNGALFDRLTMTVFQFNQGNVSIKMGTSSSSSEKFANLKIGQIGPFCFSETFDLKLINEDQNFEQMNKYYFSSAQLINDKIQSGFNVKKLREKGQITLNEILISSYNLNYLTYVYSKFETDDVNHLTKFLDMILLLLSSSKDCQSSYKSVLFLEKTIAKLFNSKMNYDLFKKLFSHFEKLSDQKLQNEFFDSIIFNMNLWCLADSSSILQIIEHFNRNMNGQFSNFFNHSCNISRLLTIYRLSFFPESTTNEISEDESVYPFYLYHKPSELKLIKESFFQFIVNKGQSSLNCQDIQNIYSHLFASHNRNEKIDILNLISSLNHSIFNLKKIEFDLISPLFKLLSSNDMTIIIHTIMTIKSISFENIHLYFSVISLFLREYSNINSLFDKLLGMAEKEVDLCSLVCSLALLLGKKKMQMSIGLLQKIDLGNLYENDKCCVWSIWPICLALNCNTNSREIVANFLCKHVIRYGEIIDHYKNIYSLIDFLAQKEKTSAYELQSFFTLDLLDAIFNTNRADVELNKLDFLIISISKVLFNHNSSILVNMPLNNLFRSCFRDDSVEKKTTDEANNFLLFQSRPRNFDEFYYSWNSEMKFQPTMKIAKKYATDYSGYKKGKKENWYKTQSDECFKKKKVFNYLYNSMSSDKEEEEEMNDKIIDDENNKSCKSFRELLNIIQNIEFGEPVFHLKINQNKKWVDLKLCNKLINYSKPFLNQNNVFSNIINCFTTIVDFMKKRIEINLVINNEKTFNILEKNVIFIQENVKDKLNPGNLFVLLNEEIKKAISVMKADNTQLLDAADYTFKINFECEINRLNNKRIELFECIRDIHKKFIRSRDSSIFLEKSSKKTLNRMNSINKNNDENKNYTENEIYTNINKNENNNNQNNNNNDNDTNNNDDNDTNNNDDNNENNNNNDTNCNNDDENIFDNKFYFSRDTTYISNYDDVLSYADNDRKFIYKRDNCLCYGFCPIKIRPKYIFKVKEAKLFNINKIIQKVGIQLDSQPNSSQSCSNESLLDSSKVDEENIQTNNDFNCKLVKIGSEIPIKLCFLNDQLSLMILSTTKIVSIYYRHVRNVFRRKKFQKDTAAEIILINGKSYLLDFERETISSQFFTKIRNVKFPLSKTMIYDSPIDFIEKNRNITAQWGNGFISNFSYLLTLNMISGRSFNDVTMYPIFPLILKTVETVETVKTISSSHSEMPLNKLNTVNEVKSQMVTSFSDLSISEKASENSEELSSDIESNIKKSRKSDMTIRDLTKNVKSNDIDEKTLQKFGLDIINVEIDSMFNPSPLPPDVIDRFMMRIEPFTSLHLSLQQGEFIADKTFTCIEKIEEEKCEIIPEFYFFPEFLMNMNSLSVSEFNFPTFNSNRQGPFDFVYRHRKLLESKKVSEKLNCWIDLIFGIRQHELKYHPAIFEEIWKSRSSSLVTAEEKIKSMMNLYGVMPSQLFVRPHSKRFQRPNMTNFVNRTNSVKMPTSPSSLPHRTCSVIYPQKKSSLNKLNEIEKKYLNDQFYDRFLLHKKDVFRHNLKCNTMIHMACSSPKNEEFFVIDKEGNDFSIQIMMNKSDHYVKFQAKIDQKEKNFWKSIDHICLIDNGFVIISSVNDAILIENNGIKTQLDNMNKNVDFIVSSQNYFAVIQNRTIISLFDTVSPYCNGQIVSIESNIVDCQINQSFAMIVFLCSDGILHFHSIQNMAKLNAVDLKKFRPKKIIISQKWGFVLVSCLNRILVFDVNGIFIRSSEFNFNLNYWTCIRSYKDFDFIVFESDKEEIGIFEAFNPQSTIQILTQVNSPVCSIDFFQDQNCIAILTKQGELVIISNYFSRF